MRDFNYNPDGYLHELSNDVLNRLSQDTSDNLLRRKINEVLGVRQQSYQAKLNQLKGSDAEKN